MNGVGLDMHARNFGAHISNMLAWIDTTAAIDQATEEAHLEAAKFFRTRDKLGPLYSDDLKARGAQALATAEAALDHLVVSLAGANPNNRARGLGIAWK